MADNLGILLYKNAQAMDIIGPWEVFSFWKNILNAHINMYLISEQELFVECVNNIILKAHINFTNSPQFDYLIIPGGPGRVEQVNNDQLISFIREQSRNCKYILSDCTGVFLLHKAGILKDESVTTYWRALAELKLFSDVKIIEDRVVKSGKVWTAGGVSSGIDLAIELIAEIAGMETAGQVQLLFEYFPKNKTYCSLNTANTLPPYQGSHGVDEPYLPEYIKNYIKSAK